jgi:hypothetical protein
VFFQFLQVNCISTEFTPKKHGGEKGVPFRIQVETYQNGDNIDPSVRLHAAACQIKVFKLKGADRKHKQDREKIMKRPLSEQEKYQPSYECTVLNDVSKKSKLLPKCRHVHPHSRTVPLKVTGWIFNEKVCFSSLFEPDPTASKAHNLITSSSDIIGDFFRNFSPNKRSRQINERFYRRYIF